MRRAPRRRGCPVPATILSPKLQRALHRLGLTARHEVHAIAAYYGKPTRTAPFGRRGLGSLCHEHCRSAKQQDALSVSSIPAAVTCEKCRAILDGGGYHPDRPVCSECGRTREEGHRRDCVLVRWYGMTAGTDE